MGNRVRSRVNTLPFEISTMEVDVYALVILRNKCCLGMVQVNDVEDSCQVLPRPHLLLDPVDNATYRTSRKKTGIFSGGCPLMSP